MGISFSTRQRVTRQPGSRTITSSAMLNTQNGVQNRLLTLDSKTDKNITIQNQIIASPPFREAQSVAVYRPVENQVHTDLIIQRCLQENKKCFVLQQSADGTVVPEPLHNPEQRPMEEWPAFDLMIVPGKAFDACGYRLAGSDDYYDGYIRALARRHVFPFLAGICFEEQLIARVPNGAQGPRMHCTFSDTATTSSLFRLIQ